MPNEIRTRSNFVGGLIENTPLTSGGTTLTSAGLANLPAISATEHAALILDPDGIAGNSEIVWVTAHTAFSTTATILRAQEGTTARAHNQDMPWVHTATVRDYEPIYVAYTPIVTQSSTVATSSAVGRYMKYGTSIHVTGSITVSGVGVVGTSISVTLPFACHTTTHSVNSPLGSAVVNDNGTAWMPAVATRNVAGDQIVFQQTNATTSTPIGTSPSFGLASGDTIGFNVTYEVA